MPLRRQRFRDVVARQLELFEREHAALIADCEEAEAAYDRAERDEAEERYGDYLELVDTAAEALAGLAYGYAVTLDEELAERYEDEFRRAVRQRWPRFAGALEEY